MSKNLKRLLRLSLLCLAGVSIAWLAVLPVTASGPFFVSPLGDDTNDCQSFATSCLTIGAAITKASAGDLIIIGSGTYTESLTLAKNLTLIGFGADTTTISGNNAQRVLYVSPGIVASMFDLAIVNGNAVGSYGGGVWNLGTLALSHARVEGNDHSGIVNSGLLTISDSVIISNTSSGEVGGGIYSYAGAVSIQHSVIDHNAAVMAAGGIFCISTVLTIADSIISNNAAGSDHPLTAKGTAPIDSNGGRGQRNPRTIPQSPPPPPGGGLWTATSCPTTITNSAIISNTAPGIGGAIDSEGNAILTNVTVSGNEGYYSVANGGTLTLTNVTAANSTYFGGYFGALDNQSGGTIFLKNTILERPCTGMMTSLGHNLDAGNSCGLNAAGDLTNTNPLLGPLQDNGGPTPTQALLPGSPAINRGSNSGCPATDQRGIPRPQGGICDIGAYELVFTDTLFLPLIAR